MTDKACMSVAELAAELGVSKPIAFSIVHKKGFPAVFIGKRIIIPTAAFMAWLDKETGSGQGKEQ